MMFRQPGYLGHDKLTFDLLKYILDFIPQSKTIVSLRSLSKAHRAAIDKIIMTPENTFMIIANVPLQNTMNFINYYRTLPAYTELQQKYKKCNVALESTLLQECQVHPLPYLCYALTTDDIYTINPKLLAIALENDIEDYFKKKTDDKDTLLQIKKCLQNLRVVCEVVNSRLECKDEGLATVIRKKAQGFINLARINGATFTYTQFHYNSAQPKFRPLNLEKCKLQGANLELANLEFVDLNNADLSHANLEGADLRCANLEGINLTAANCRGVLLHHARLVASVLITTNFTAARLDYCNLNSANLDQTIFDYANLNNVYLHNAEIFSISLNGALFTNVKILFDLRPEHDEDWEIYHLTPENIGIVVHRELDQWVGNTPEVKRLLYIAMAEHLYALLLERDPRNNKMIMDATHEILKDPIFNDPELRKIIEQITNLEHLSDEIQAGAKQSKTSSP